MMRYFFRACLNSIFLVYKKISQFREFKAFKTGFKNKFPLSFIEPANIFDINRVEVGEYSYGPLKVMMWSNEDLKLKIGRFVSIAADVMFILGCNHQVDSLSTYAFKHFFIPGQEDMDYGKGSIEVKDDVWIATGAVIMSGVTINQGAIVAAYSVVTKDVPSYAVVAGNPAKVVKYRFERDTIDKLLETADYSKLTPEKIAKNIDLLYEKLSEDNIERIKEIFN